MLAAACAKHLDVQLAALTFNEAGVGGNLFVDHMPQSPDTAVMLTHSPGFEQRTKAPTTLPSVQVIVRALHIREGFDLASEIFDELACLDGVLLDQGGVDEVFVIGLTAATSGPVAIGQDENRRHEWSLNFDGRIHQPTAHRPAVPTP